MKGRVEIRQRGELHDGTKTFANFSTSLRFEQPWESISWSNMMDLSYIERSVSLCCNSWRYSPCSG